MAGRRSHITRGIYWSMRCEDGAAEPFFIRKQDEHFKTNNDAEWLAVKEALNHAVQYHKDEPLVIYSDSMLVVNQFNGVWKTRIARHFRFKAECEALRKQLKFVVVEWVSRNVNVEKLGH